MAHSSFGTGWPACDRSKIVTLVRADGLRLPLHRDLVELAAISLDVVEALGYDIRPDWTWGYACRAVAGTRTPSNHSWGTAGDINAPRNPRRARGLPMVSDIPAKVIAFLEGVGWTWGGRWAWPDPMHFEWRGTAADARRTADNLRRFFAAQGGKTPPPPQHVGSPRRPAPRTYPGPCRMGDGMPPAKASSTVRVWQQVLVERGYDLKADGQFGQATNHVVVHWQQGHALKPDGIAGPATWHSLLYA